MKRKTYGIKEVLLTFLNDIPKDTLYFLKKIVQIHSLLNEWNEKNFSNIEKKMIAFFIAIKEVYYFTYSDFENKKERKFYPNLSEEEIEILKQECQKQIELTDEKWIILEQEYLPYLYEGDCFFKKSRFITVIEIYHNFWNIEFPENIIFTNYHAIFNSLNKEVKFYLMSIENIYCRIGKYHYYLDTEIILFIALYEIPTKLQSPEIRELLKILPQEKNRLMDFIYPPKETKKNYRPKEYLISEMENDFLKIIDHLKYLIKDITIFEIIYNVMINTNFNELSLILNKIHDHPEEYYKELLQNLKIIKDDAPLLNTLDLIRTHMDDTFDIEEEINSKTKELNELSVMEKIKNKEILFLTSFFYHQIKVVQEIVLKTEEETLTEEINALIESCFLEQKGSDVLTNIKRKFLKEPPIGREFNLEQVRIALPKLDSKFETLTKEIEKIECIKAYMKCLLSKLSECIVGLNENKEEILFAKQSFQIDKNCIELEIDVLEQKKNAFLKILLTLNTLRNYLYPLIISKKQRDDLNLWQEIKESEIIYSLKRDKKNHIP